MRWSSRRIRPTFERLNKCRRASTLRLDHSNPRYLAHSSLIGAPRVTWWLTCSNIANLRSSSGMGAFVLFLRKCVRPPGWVRFAFGFGLLLNTRISFRPMPSVVSLKVLSSRAAFCTSRGPRYHLAAMHSGGLGRRNGPRASREQIGAGSGLGHVRIPDGLTPGYRNGKVRAWRRR